MKKYGNCKVSAMSFRDYVPGVKPLEKSSDDSASNCGIKVITDEPPNKAEFVLDSLEVGKQKLLLLSAANPMEMVFCTQDRFLEFCYDVAPLVAKSAIKASKVVDPKVGDIVLACEDQFWHRALIIRFMNASAVEVCVVDFAYHIIVQVNKLRFCESDLLHEPVLGVTCCMESWFLKDLNLIRENWDTTMNILGNLYTEHEVEVLQVVDDKILVKIPILEEKLLRGRMLEYL